MNRLRNILACLTPVLLLATGHSRAATAVWSDSFETNAPSRWYSTGAWKIGSPTAGPATNALGYRTYSGTNCASTQGYSPPASGLYVRLVCTNYNGNSTLLVPPAGLSPRLRFEQWYSFANAFAHVEVSTNFGTNWTQLSPTYPSTNGGTYYSSGGGVWSRPSIDLSAYGSQNIQIAFYFAAGSYQNNSLGWFVDDVEVDEGAPILNFPEGFEAGEGDWSVDFGGWQICKPTGGSGAAHSGTNCAANLLSGGYANYVDSRLISPPFLVPSSGSPQLRFWQWYSLNNALGWVEINNGAVNGTTTTNVTITTNQIAQLNTGIYQFSGQVLAGYTSPFYYNATIGAWTNATKVFGIVSDQLTAPYGAYFEAGNPPFTSYLSPIAFNSIDYRATNVVSLTLLTNLQGTTWIPINGGYDVVGNFGTTNTTTYTTNTSTAFSQSSWTVISPTNGLPGYSSSSGGWTNVWLDLSSYAGQMVEIAFHFSSGGIDTAPGWFVDDILVTSQPQLLTAPTNETIFAGQTFSQELIATNPLLPNATYSFSAPSFPGLQFTANGANGAIMTWTNTGVVNGVLNWTNLGIAPNTYTVPVIATDNNGLTATNSFQLIIQQPPAPTLTIPANQDIVAGQTLTVPVSATNPVVPNALYTYQLLSGPANATITNGVITWPTSDYQSNGASLFVVSVSDDSQPPLSTNNSFVVLVTNLLAPTLIVPVNQTNYAGQTMTVTNFASNLLDGDTYDFSLISSNLPGLDISQLATEGILKWNISILQPAGTYTIAIQVTDEDLTNYNATGSFLVTVLNPPQPVLTLPPTQLIYAGARMDITSISVTNPAFPGSKYSFAVTNSPAGVSISSLSKSTGELIWTTTATNLPNTATIYVVATDDHTPPLSASGSFAVVVKPTPKPSLANTAVRLSGGGLVFTVDTPVTNAPWQILATTNINTQSPVWTPIYTNTTSSLMFTDLLATNYLQRFFRVVIP